ncbi:MAG: GNAT family N-acetyltransferase [Candidatus Marsarchaeota archaeon]|nr:GNAT family N-acetyltransferase [Candidatus Marsarchaeota archaeon]
MQIREPDEGDFAGLAALILRIYDEIPFATTFSARPSTEELESIMRKKLDGMRGRTVADLIAIDNGQVIADCEIAKTTDAGGMIGIIVDKAHRGKGLGRRLVERCADKARLFKMLEVYAEVDDRNEGAARFFSRCGFREQEGEESLVLIRHL